jgi:hypothetical protein
VRFWFRRQAHEVAIHRWDVEGAGSVPERQTGSVPERRTGAVIARGLADDGIAEWLDFTRVFGATRHASRDETVHLHCTDTDTDGEGGEWLVTLTSEGAEIEPVHAKGDVAARGTASDLDLFLWGRVGFEALEVFGDAGLLERFRAAGMS